MILIIGFLFMVFVYSITGIISKFLFTLASPWSALIILVSFIFFILVTKSAGIIGRYIITSFKKNYAYTKNELESLSLALKNIIKFILAIGALNFFIWGIITLGYIGLPQRIGPSLVISLTSLTYSIAASFFIFFPAQVWAENKINTLGKS